MSEIRIAVVGAGAIGCRLAAHLAQHDVTVTLIDGWAAHVEAVRADGLRLRSAEGSTATFRLPAHHYEAPPAGPFDVILLAVRSDETAARLPLVRQLLAPEGYVVSCQNGINEDAIAEAIGVERTLGCSMVFGARLAAPGWVEVLAGPDTLKLGELSGERTARLEALQQLFGYCGTATVSSNLLGYRWMKLILNATGNPLLLLSGLTGHTLHDDAEIRGLMRALAGEILRTAALADVRVEPIMGEAPEVWLADDPSSIAAIDQALQRHGVTLGERRLSMVADFAARGRTEVDHINGYAVRKAATQGRSLPLNQQVVDLVHALEAGQLAPGRPALAPLFDRLSNAPA